MATEHFNVMPSLRPLQGAKRIMLANMDSDSLTYHWPTPEGFVRQYSLPSGRVIVLDPNGLGQATKASSGSTNYASNITYHVNGALDRLTYGNGFVRDTRLNARQLIDQIKDTKGSTRALYYDYAFDKNGRITRIYDEARGNSYDRTYAYDDLGRLESAAGKWGSGTYTYDALGNIRKKRLGSRTVEMLYDSKNRLHRFRDTAQGGNAWQSVAYDNRGNVTDNGTASLGGLRFTYDGSFGMGPERANSRSPSPMRRRARSPMTAT